MSGVTRSNTTGPTQLPFSHPGTVKSEPSARHSAPSSLPAFISVNTRCFAAAEISGPKPASGSFHRPGLISLMRLASSGIHFSDPPTNTAAEIAIQRCPAAPTDAPTRLFRTCSLFASGMITVWFFAPAKHWARFRFAVAVL